MTLLNDDIIKKLPSLYATENQTDPILYARFFLPDSSWSWYLSEYDASSKICFGYVCGLENELGYFSLEELEAVKSSTGMKIQRDLFFTPTRLSEVKKNVLQS